ncbi:protein PRY1 [Eurytemora carolleeae]|uniref:protein PRY1 n=1 Tax=Eurytemora carolleeae TaxID=1294199 RepID=UPI000C76B3D1|nr:protein PRY1 [Eurytemora carolleeae]|eukprot:XP_023341668.1 protein PRY1-like [Eurytemora affinis]
MLKKENPHHCWISRMSSSEGEQVPEERKDGAQVQDNRPFTLVHKTIKKTVNGVTSVKQVTEKVFMDGTREKVKDQEFGDMKEKMRKEMEEECRFEKLKDGSKTNGDLEQEGRKNTGKGSSSDVGTKSAGSKEKQANSGSDSSSDEDKESESNEDDKFAKKSLEEHNKFRRKHGVPPLTLNKEMCMYSQEWAEYLIAENRFQHRTDHKYGENIFTSWSSRPKKPDPKVPVQSWYDEIKKYQFGSEPQSSGTGHFTQVVWKESSELGVGVASKDGRVIVVANYNPPGNFMGKFSRNVPAPL